ncbi:O-methyltransferase [Amycolatopsis regifaucium]|uniref:SAM-dependent methyltransferase n=1 Tax=Amycolatopsis regifaucium TaxID=546365 RepID=A0A154MUM1_9PSEU|nr:O-methyltransferase [Amycolatopsis regifaucium]KZB87985.1 SAM-dependent methyltransferase [Amycolatopsis regifaucium]OKA04510.1 SAM-dependent methyltransferase [Amycolatopsis regifaucium]SFH51046.1 caffeoyl-CoA O-methyltransferase [Amycolatopsis regifaucium]
MTNTETQPEKAVSLTPEVLEYVRGQLPPFTEVQQELIDATLALGGVAEMQVPPEQGALLTLLARLTGARVAVEVGTFTGYSTLALAEGVGPGGRVITCDISDGWLEIASNAWTKAGVADRVETVVGPAAETLGRLPDEPFVDLAFIDADKVGYIGYWEALVPRIRPNGLIAADNVLYAGEAASPDAEGNARAIRAFNEHVLRDDRVESVMLTVADGLTLARKKN